MPGHVVTADPARDARHFENVTAAVDDLVPRAEVLRPGLLVLAVRGAARFGSNRQRPSGWWMRLPRPVPNARWESPTSCPPRSSPHAPGESSRPAKMRCSCRRCPSGSWPPNRAWRRPVAKTWRICCGAWGSKRRAVRRAVRADVASRFGADAVAAHRFARGEPNRGPSGREPLPGSMP